MEALFPNQLGQSAVDDIVDSALTWFLPPLYLRSTHPHIANQPQPADLLRQLEAAAQNAAIGERQTQEPPNPNRVRSSAEDSALAQMVLGATPEAIRLGLTRLAKEELNVDFVIVAEYLDQAEQLDGLTPRTIDVVTKLRCHTILPREAITERRIEQAMQRFRNRLAAATS